MIFNLYEIMSVEDVTFIFFKSSYTEKVTDVKAIFFIPFHRVFLSQFFLQCIFA